MTEDLLRPCDDATFSERRDRRLKALIERQVDFILDATSTGRGISRPALERARATAGSASVWIWEVVPDASVQKRRGIRIRSMV